MEEPKRNRLNLAELETYTPKTKTPNWMIWTWIAVALLLATFLSLGIYWKFFRDNTGVDFSKSKGLLNDKRALDTLLETPYLPDSVTNGNLNKCIQLYKDNYIKKALIVCEEFLNTPESDEDKSLALTTIGLIYDGAGRYPLAIERHKKAIQYNPKNFYAYYNLALAFKHSGKFAEAKKVIEEGREIAPKDSRIALLAGNLLSDLGDTNAAIDAYKVGLNSTPEDAYLTYNLALSYLRQGKPVESIEYFLRAIELSPFTQIAVLSHGHLGNIHYANENWDKSEYHFREALRLKPNEAKYLYNLGLLLKRKGQNEEAVSYFKKALESGSNDPEVYRSVADAFANLGMTGNAVTALEKSLQVSPNDLDSSFDLADLYYARGDLVQAEAVLRKIIQTTPGDAYTETAYINLGIVLDEMGRYSESISAFERAIEINPKNDKAYYNLGVAAKHAGLGTKAVENFRKASYLNPNSNLAKQALGDYLSENGFYKQAITEYQQGLDIDPKDDKLRIKLATALEKAGNADASEAELKKVLNNSQNGATIKEAHKNLALLYGKSNDSNKTSKAKEEAFRASHIDPNDMESRLVLAKVLLDSGSLLDREKAIDELQVIVRSTAKQNVIAKAYNYLGICYFKNGEYTRAIREFQNAVDLDPNFAEAYDNKRAARAQYEQELSKNNRSIY